MKSALKIKICSAMFALAFCMPGLLSATTVYTTALNGANEVPPTGSPGTGNATVTLNGDTLTVNLSFSGLTQPASAAHIHCCGPVGMNEVVAVPFTNFPAATSGTYLQSFDLTLLATYNAPYVTANGGTAASAEAALIAALNAGQTYTNIHNANFPGGEVRGQLEPVPEPGAAGLLLLGLTPTLVFLRRRLR
jgi:hypothetical protein